jgi:hypothetical protein
MKIRRGFVSNSSSSSFICDISGQAESGMDCSLEDFEMAECTEGHTFFTDGWPEVESWLTGDDDDSGEGDRYGVPKEFCPICNGKAKKDIVARLKGEMKRLNVTIEDFA